jgi:hypothetical protein
MRVGFNQQLKRARFHRYSCFDDSEERSIGKLRLRYLRSSLLSGKPALRRRTIPSRQQPLAWTIEEHESFIVRDDRPGARLFTIFDDQSDPAKQLGSFATKIVEDTCCLLPMSWTSATTRSAMAV